MKVTVCEFPDEMNRLEGAWSDLISYCSRFKPDVVILPEMPFFTWPFVGEEFEAAIWREAVTMHGQMCDRLGELGVGVVISSRPIERSEQRLNEAFIWSTAEGYKGVRAKWYLPDDPMARETIWFDQGDRDFRPVIVDDVGIGFQLCSEMMYPEHAREIGLQGAHLIAQPRATGGDRRWLIAASMSAVTSGCYVASANRRSYERDWFPGGSWLMSPDAEVLASTTSTIPFATAFLDLSVIDQAKQRYPRDLHRMYAVRS